MSSGEMAERYLELAQQAETVARLMSLREDRAQLLQQARSWREEAARLSAAIDLADKVDA